MTSRWERIARFALLAALVALLGAGSSRGAPAARGKARAPRAASKGQAAADSNQVLVRIGNEAITRGDIQRRIDALPEQFRANYTTPEGRQQLLDRMVEEKVWLSLAMKNGVADRPQVRLQIEQQRRDLLIRTYLSELMAKNPTPSDSDAHLYYDQHLNDYKVPATVTVRHIQSKTEAEAKRVKQWARSGQDWNKLAEKYSADTLTRKNGGSLGTVTREGMFASIGAQPALAESAFTLKEGQIGGPYKTDKGWHVIKVEARKDESERPFDQVRQMIVRQLGSQRQQDFYKNQLDEARRSLNVKPDSAAIKRFVSQKKTAREMFNEAQAAGPPEARIEAYQRLLAEFPDSEVSPQAQFMVGFIYSEELKKYDEAEKSFRQLLSRYPKAELAASAQWMIDHMRSEDTPSFINLDSDSTADDSSPKVAVPGKSESPKATAHARKP